MESGGATSFCAGLLEPPLLLPAGCGLSPDSSESLRRWNEEGPGDAGPRATCISAVTCQVLSRPSELLAGRFHAGWVSLLRRGVPEECGGGVFCNTKEAQRAVSGPEAEDDCPRVTARVGGPRMGTQEGGGTG